MLNRQKLKEFVSQIHLYNFQDIALSLFNWQAIHNPIYAQYLNYLQINPTTITSLEKIPFLPIEFFKTQSVITQHAQPQIVFESSGTTGSHTSRHFVADLDWYNHISTTIFEQIYAPLSHFHLLALLPSYLERNNSSLVYMVQDFIQKTQSELSGFFLHNIDDLLKTLQKLAEKKDNKPVILWGVTFALLDLAESRTNLDFLRQLPNLIIMETGGMKGRREELTRAQIHEQLKTKFGVSFIHSEYGMTELLSQSYSKGDGIFTPSATMQILLRDINDPFAVFTHQNSPLRYGGINVIDLANIDSCAFIETQDLGRFINNTSNFEVIGRFDNSDVRGCNLLLS